MYAWKRRRASLMPAVALATLSAMIAIPALSQARLFAAGPQQRAGVTVHHGDSLWSIADRSRYGRPHHGGQRAEERRRGPRRETRNSALALSRAARQYDAVPAMVRQEVQTFGQP